MKKYLMIIMITVTCLTIFAGCGNKQDSSQQEKNPVATGKEGKISSSPVINTPTPAVSEATVEPQQEEVKVCFIGNSLIQYGRQAYFLKDIALGYGRRVSVDQLTWGGSHLEDYIKGTFMSVDTVKKKLKKADIVVFQDYGGWKGEDTVKSIRKLEKWCKKGAEYFYYMYEGDDLEMVETDYKKLNRLGVDIIPKGQLIDGLYEMSYSYEDLHLEEDFHPNNFNGFFSALIMYGVIFGDKCADYPKDWFMEDNTEEASQPVEQIREKLHGDSQDEIWKEFHKICKKADKLIKKRKIPNKNENHYTLQ